MTKHPFAPALGAYYWEKLERLADFYGHTNKSEYAVNLLKRAIDESEMWRRADLFAHYEQLIADLEAEQDRLREEYSTEDHSSQGEMDDGIPF